MHRVAAPQGVPNYYPRHLDESLRDDFYQELWVQHLEQPTIEPRALPAVALAAVRRKQGYSKVSRMWSAAPLRELPSTGHPGYESADLEAHVQPAEAYPIDASVLKRGLPISDWPFVDQIVLGKRLEKPMSPAAKTRARHRILAVIRNLKAGGDKAKLERLFTESDL